MAILPTIKKYALPPIRTVTSPLPTNILASGLRAAKSLFKASPFASRPTPPPATPGTLGDLWQQQKQNPATPFINPKVNPSPKAPMAQSTMPQAPAFIPRSTPIIPQVPTATAAGLPPGTGTGTPTFDPAAYTFSGGMNAYGEMLPGYGQGNGTPSPVGTPPPAPSAPVQTGPDFSTLEAEYRRNLQLSPEEIASQEALRNAYDSLNKGLLNEEGRAIPMALLTGRQNALVKQASNAITPLQDRLALAQAKRQAALEQSKFALSRADEQAKLARAENAPIEISPGSSLLRKNADGTYTTAYTAPAQRTASTEITEVNGRKVLIDKTTGDIVSDLGAATDVTKPMSGEAAKVYAIATTIAPEINALKQAFSQDYKGALTGIVTGTNRELVKLVDQVADKVGRLRSGGAINKDEEARFKRQIGGLGDLAFGNPQAAITALDGILAEANSVASNIRPSNFGSSQSGGVSSWANFLQP